MSKKNLARSLTERGRHESWYTLKDHVSRRARSRAYEKFVTSDPSFAEEVDFYERRLWRGEDEHSWSVLHKWLDAHVGQPWNEIHSELCRLPDARRTTGRRGMTLVEAVRGLVDWQHRFPHWGCSWGFRVDDEGILRNEASPWKKYRPEKLVYSYRSLREWLDSRVFIVRGDDVFWGYPTQIYWVICRDPWCELEHKEFVSRWQKTWDGRPVVIRKHVEWLSGHWRQGSRLNERELEVWKKLTPRQREMFSVVK